MRMLAFGLAAALSACGGGGDEPSEWEMREAAFAYAKEACEDHRGLGKIVWERVVRNANGDALRIRMLCQCRDGGLVYYPPK